MKYHIGTGVLKNWIVSEEQFDSRNLGKCESIMALGNGYMGIRSATEESYIGEVRNTFVAGTFNKFDESEVTELPNAADVTQMDMEFNGCLLDLSTGAVKNYCRQLNLKTGELKRSLTWISPSGDEIDITFRRFVSLANLHITGQKVDITPLYSDINLNLKSGINAQMSNSGVQHFSEGEKRLHENKYLQLIQTTTQSKIHFIINSAHNFTLQSEKYQPKSLICMDRRKIFFDFDCKLPKGKTLTIEKISGIYTTRDKEYENMDINALRALSCKALKTDCQKGYDRLMEESADAWQEKVWKACDIKIHSEDDFDQLAVRFALYHLAIMTPAHDSRMNIGAKGLSGEGYKGHTFWDTELFILPFWIYENPKVARSLLEYRYNTLPGARKKALDNGYEGAMFPWESAWLEDGEVTPVWGSADIVTGEATKIWTGFIAQHITSDIAFAIWQYYQITGDENFMELYGYELFMDTAKFWCSRLEWNEECKQYHINDVLGPDEYKEHINNNAYTNYMAHWTIKNAIQYYEFLKENRKDIFDRLDNTLKLTQCYGKWTEKVNYIYLPKADKNLIIAQDDTYLKKAVIDLTRYKKQEHVGSIFKDYNIEQINKIQVSKQADVMILFYLLEKLFTREEKIANWNYYEPKTLHDSSLSLSTHCVIANDLGSGKLAYELFRNAANIDLGSNMKTSNQGIHAASLGGLWQCVVNGFGGVRMLDGRLRIQPKLPEAWSELSFELYWRSDRLAVKVYKEGFEVHKVSSNHPVIEFDYNDKSYSVADKVFVKF